MNEVNEIPRNIPKVRVLSEIEKEEALVLAKTKNREGIKVKFDEACESGQIKPGMIVRFKNPTFGPIFLDKERTGCKEDQNYEGKIEDGIVVKLEDKYYVITAFEGSFSLRGRYGYAYCYEIMREIRNKALGHYFTERSKIEMFDERLYRNVCNLSFIYQKYFEQYRYRDFILGRASGSGRNLCYMCNGKFYVVDTDVLSNYKKVSGALMSIISPLDTCCYMKSLIKKEGSEYYTYSRSQFPFYVEF